MRRPYQAPPPDLSDLVPDESLAAALSFVFQAIGGRGVFIAVLVEAGIRYDVAIAAAQAIELDMEDEVEDAVAG